MEIVVAEQTKTFLYALLVGALLGVLYDLFRILRLTFPAPSWLVLLEDLLYFLLAGTITAAYLLGESRGQLRLFIGVGVFLGWAFYAATAGVWVMKAARVLVALLRRTLYAVLRPAAALARGTGRAFSAVSAALGAAVRRIKNRLNLRVCMMYNRGVKKRRRGERSGAGSAAGTDEEKAAIP